MPLSSLLLVAAVMFGLAVLRFGVPALLTWAVSRLLGAFAHPAA